MNRLTHPPARALAAAALAMAPAVLFALPFDAHAQTLGGDEADTYVHDCGLVHPDTLHGLEPVPPKPFELPLQRDEHPRVQREAPRGIGPKHFGSPTAKLREGALTGKTVYLSPGHGFYWSPSFASGSADNTWRTQRPNTFNVVEDLISTETL